MFLKSIITKARRFTSSITFKIAFLTISSLLIFDVLVAVLGSFYFSDSTGAFLGKSTTINLSNLLFIEGAFILAIGTFIAVARAWQEPKPSSEPTTQPADSAEQIGDERIHNSTLMIIVGAVLIGLSILVGTLLL